MQMTPKNALIRGSFEPKVGSDFSMAIRIKSRQGETVNQMLRRFKKLCEKEGLTKDVKRRQYFEKPSERRRRAMRKAISRATRMAMPGGGQGNNRRSSGPGGPRRGGGGGGGGGGRSGGR